MNVVKGSILDHPGDVIVNPANSFLRHAGGLARVIDRAATSLPDAVIAAGEPLVEATAYDERIAQYQRDHVDAPLIATGCAYWTSAGALPYKGIIHAVGPIWAGGDACEPDLLELAYESVFASADVHNCEHVGVPAISCGVFGYPPFPAAKIATAVAKWCDDLKVTFYVPDESVYEAFKAYA